jgi:hypothetical protein
MLGRQALSARSACRNGLPVTRILAVEKALTTYDVFKDFINHSHVGERQDRIADDRH